MAGACCEYCLTILHTGQQNKKLQTSSRDKNTDAGNVIPPIDEHESAAQSTAPQSNDEVEVSDTPTTSELDSLEAIEGVHILECHSTATKRAMARLEKVAFHYYYSGTPRTDLLLHLVQFNFTRALMENTRILGLTSDQLHDDAISPFNTLGPWQNDSLQNLPIMLQPTAIQRCIPHHPWLDLLPEPQLRDNLILAGDFEEETQLCLDMKGSGTPKSQRSGIIVWGDPWDPLGWEITEPFAHSWGWVIRNCRDLAYSTNQWRAKRHERPLFRMT
jgi:hypothetical protein